MNRNVDPFHACIPGMYANGSFPVNHWVVECISETDTSIQRLICEPFRAPDEPGLPHDWKY